MPLDPQIIQVMETVAALGLPPADTVSPEVARANAKLRKRSPGPEVAKVEDRTIPGPDSDVPVRIYTPEGDGPFPILAWFHGGGWVVGDLEHCVDELNAYIKDYSITDLVTWAVPPGLRPGDVRDSLEQFATDVAPRLRAAAGSP